MSKRSLTPYRTKLSRAYIFYVILFRFAPCWLYHFLIRPYRQEMPTIGAMPLSGMIWRKRLESAFYDTICHTLLSGYTEVTGLKPAAPTGQMLSLFLELIFGLDKQLEQRLESNDRLTVHDALELPPLKDKREAFHQYLQLFDRKEPVLLYLRELLTAHDDSYTRRLKAAKSTERFDDVYKAAQVDSGIALYGVMKIIAIFNGHELSEAELNNFYLGGMAAKFGDDMSDLVRDIQRGYPNLLFTLVRLNATEWDTLQKAIKQHVCIDVNWWKRYCPITFSQYFEYLEHYYNQINSSKLKLICDIMLIYAVLGRVSDHTEIGW